MEPQGRHVAEMSHVSQRNGTFRAVPARKHRLSLKRHAVQRLTMDHSKSAQSYVSICVASTLHMTSKGERSVHKSGQHSRSVAVTAACARESSRWYFLSRSQSSPTISGVFLGLRRCHITFDHRGKRAFPLT